MTFQYTYEYSTHLQQNQLSQLVWEERMPRTEVGHAHTMKVLGIRAQLRVCVRICLSCGFLLLTALVVEAQRCESEQPQESPWL